MKKSLLLLPGILFMMAAGIAGAADVRDFGAAGDGETDDTAAIERAVRETADGKVRFPSGTYRITRTVEIDLDRDGPVSLDGEGGAGRVVMAGPGPAFRFKGTHEGTANPESFEPDTLERERMPQLDGLEIAGAHEGADGVEFIRVMQPTLRGVLIRDVRHGVRLVERNRNLIIESSHIYNCRGVGVFLDHVDLHQAIIHGNHISYCRGGGIVVADGGIRNLHITGNTIEYNYDPDAEQSADILIDTGEGSVREGSITGNTIQARPSPGGANIRIRGGPDSPDKAGLWSITGNHISNQEINVHLDRVRGVSLSGNTYIRGGRMTMLIEGSRHVTVTGDVIDRNPDYYRGNLYRDMRDGIRIQNSEGVILNGLLIDGARLGSMETGGAIEVLDSREVTVTGCQVLNPRYQGIGLSGTRHALIVSNTIVDRTGEGLREAAVAVTGESQGIIIRGNMLGAGEAGTVVDQTGKAMVDGNQQVEDY